MEAEDATCVFAAQGYLALSLPHMEDAGVSLDRHWLAAGSMADIKLSMERSSLMLTLGVKGTVYVRNTIADGSWCFRFGRAADARLFTDRIQHSVEIMAKPTLLFPSTSGYVENSMPTHDPLWPEGDTLQLSRATNADSHRLASLVHNALKDPDLPELVRIVEEMWDQVSDDAYQW